MLDHYVNESVINGLLLIAKLAAAYIALIWLSLCIWTFRDIRRRTKDPFIQGAAVGLTAFFFVPGYWLYLILRPGLTLSERAEERLRETLLREYAPRCPKCAELVRDDFILCPACYSSLRNPCVNCSHALHSNWTICPYCGQQAHQKADGNDRVPQLQGQPAAVGEPVRV